MALEPLARAWRYIETHLHANHFGLNGILNIECDRTGRYVTDLVLLFFMAKVLIIL